MRVTPHWSKWEAARNKAARPCLGWCGGVVGRFPYNVQLCSLCNRRYQEIRAATYRVMWHMRHNFGLPPASDFLCVEAIHGARRVFAEHWDHRDYRDPNRIEPVCAMCNHTRGAAYETVR